MMSAPEMPSFPVPPVAAQAPPMFGANPQGKKPKPKSQQTTFLGSEASPVQGQLGQKTLLGQ